MRKTALIALLALGFLAVSAMAEEQAQTQTPEFSYKFRRGGSFSIEPALLIPSSPLDKKLDNTLGYNLDFDIGVSPDISVVFGGGYYNMRGRQNPDYYFLLTPMWFGVKSKNQFLPSAEVWWEAAAALYYEKSYFIASSNGDIQNLDGGGTLAAGFDVWWTRWLLTGFSVKSHLIVEESRVYPFMQLGFKVGIRG